MAKSKRSNYLIDKPFQLGFILRYVVIILFTMSVAFGVSAMYYFWDSMWGENKLDTQVNYYRRGQLTLTGNPSDSQKLFFYSKENMQVYKSTDASGKTVYKSVRNTPNHAANDVIEISDERDLEPDLGGILTVTTRFHIVIYPLLWTCLSMIFLVSVYSLFFSHKMAGPIYRMRVSLDRMISGDYDFRIRARKSDFFLNIVEKLELLRAKINEEK